MREGKMQAALEVDYPQSPLIHFVYTDDAVLMNFPAAKWFQILRDFPWQRYRGYAAKYYDALYAFNQAEAVKREQRLDAQQQEGAIESSRAGERAVAVGSGYDAEHARHRELYSVSEGSG